jgi:DNA sulfur modification protein DndD
MILREVKLTNFRQFAGEQMLTFSVDPEKNVTVLHGFNGAGKTTLLNAFTWALYGQCTPDFEHPDKLETEAVFAGLAQEATMDVAVKLVFDDTKGGVKRKFLAERRLQVRKIGDGGRVIVREPVLSVHYVEEDGATQDSGNPQDTIDSILPQELCPFFFFNGERIDELAKPEAYERIDRAVRTLLDLTPIERAIQHLGGKITNDLRAEVAEHAAADVQEAKRSLDQLDEEHGKILAKLGQLKRNIEALETEKEAIDSKLALIPEVKGLKLQRDEMEKRRKAILQSLSNLRGDLAKNLSRHAYILLAPAVLKRATETLNDARNRGELPGPIKQQFVKDLLAEGKCICARPLEEGSEERAAVEEWKEQTHSDELEALAGVTSAGIGSLQTRADRCRDDIREAVARKDSLQGDLQYVREQLDDISHKISTQQSSEDPDKLEARRREIEDQIGNVKLERSHCESTLRENEDKIREAKRKIEQCEIADQVGLLAQRRLTAVSNVRDALDRILQCRFRDIHRDLLERLEEVWSSIAIKNYTARLSEDFRLQLTKMIGTRREPVVGASTGEKQVLSLAFVGALGDKARSTYHAAGAGDTLFKGGLYPLVIDSAFGTLEVDYRRDVTRWITTLAPQLIIMVSESQWRKEVEEEMSRSIGKEYVMKYETPKQKARMISLRGREYPYVVQSDDGHERAVFEEVK